MLITRVKKLWVRMRKNKWTPVVSASLLAGLFCISVFGYKILLPTNTDWLYANGDISQHQIGWDFFRHDAWRMPLGSMKNLATPEGSSLVYMDSIPLVAIVFKVFSPILPEHFQYLGLWGLLAFVLQGALGSLIIRKYTRDPLLIVLGTMFIVTAPILLFRSYAHTALSTQWLILAGFCLVLYRDKIRSRITSIALWTALFAVAAGIHPYFVPISGFILLAYLVLRKKGWLDALIHLGAAGLGFLGSFWLMGGFVTKNVGTATLGMFGADVNALINPINYSYFLRPMPTSTGAYEGIAYLGLGVYLLLLILVAQLLFGVKRIRLATLYKSVRNWVRQNVRILIVCGIIIVTVLLAIGPVIYINGNHIFTFAIPDNIARLMSIFRSTGRFMWIACYVITIAAVAGLVTIMSKKNKSNTGLVLLMMMVLGIQLVDVVKSEGVRSKASIIRQGATRENRFARADVSTLMSGKLHVAYVENNLHSVDFFELGEIVASRNMTINDGYISRKSDVSVSRETEIAHKELTADVLRRDTVYVTNNEADTILAAANPAVQVIKIDTTWLVALR